jgi:hypothetical protein
MATKSAKCMNYVRLKVAACPSNLQAPDCDSRGLKTLDSAEKEQWPQYSVSDLDCIAD